MGTKFKDVGGGPAVGLADNLVNWLSQGVFGGNFGGQPGSDQRFMQANPTGAAGGIGNILNDIFSGGAGKVGGALAALINNQQTRDIGNIRARYGASGGMSLGTPGASGEALYRAEAAPQIATAVSGMQMQAMQPILQMLMGLGQKGISQRTTVAEPNPVVSAIGSVAPVVSTLLGPGGALASLIGGGGRGAMPFNPMASGNASGLPAWLTDAITSTRPPAFDTSAASLFGGR